MPYDFESITHSASYSSEAINPSEPIITVKNRSVSFYEQTMGRRGEMSDIDIIKINRKYKCSGN